MWSSDASDPLELELKAAVNHLTDAWNRAWVFCRSILRSNHQTGLKKPVPGLPMTPDCGKEAFWNLSV